jgi:hypothetical protein
MTIYFLAGVWGFGGGGGVFPNGTVLVSPGDALGGTGMLFPSLLESILFLLIITTPC